MLEQQNRQLTDSETHIVRITHELLYTTEIKKKLHKEGKSINQSLA